MTYLLCELCLSLQIHSHVLSCYSMSPLGLSEFFLQLCSNFCALADFLYETVQEADLENAP